jgi:hypothetical protein
MQRRDGHAQGSSISNQVLEMAPQSKPPGFHIVSINPGGNVARFNGNLMLILLGQKLSSHRLCVMEDLWFMIMENDNSIEDQFVVL